MTQRADTGAQERLAREYAAALREYVGGAGEEALTRAYELGRKAASDGLGVLDVVTVHHDAVRDLLAGRAKDESSLVSLASQFLTDSLSPFEMTLRAYQANARWLGLSDSLAMQNAEIDRARQQLRTILDATTALIYLKDAEGRYLFVNRQFEHVFSLRREQVVGRTDEEVLPESIARALHDDDARVLEGRAPQELEERILLADGPRTYLSLKFPLIELTGAPYALCCVATDITERKTADEALKRAKEAAEAANTELESFSFSVAHDLRAPLRSIDGFSQALLEDCADRLEPQDRKHLRYVRESAQHMAQLIDDLLSLSRVSRADLRRERVALTAVARRIVERLKVREPERHVEIAIQNGVWGDGDARLLEVALENLLGNAWKFTGKREMARIEFGAEPDVHPTVYFVRDNGAGFDMTYAGKLFGVFQRLHAANEFEGTGIGLATVQRVVRRHGGRVWAEGEPDRGATFYFTLGDGDEHP